MTAPLLVVPPFLKSLAGPLAGPAQLEGVAASAGVPMRVIDLNAGWLRSFPVRGGRRGPSGDHARPEGGFVLAEDEWTRLILSSFAPAAAHCTDPLAVGSHEQVERAAAHLARSPIGSAWSASFTGPRPGFAGISVLWRGQVVAALALSILLRQRWPGIVIVWGGAHVTALAPEIASDSRYGRLVDGFVAGYAEHTFRAMLQGNPLAAPGVFVAGCGRATRAEDDSTVIPAFSRLRAYGVPKLSLPVQTGRGCAYGRCAFCTYPAIEGNYRDVGLGPLRHVADVARRRGGDVSVKDALVPSGRLNDIAQELDGAVEWSACTRLVPRIGRDQLTRLVRGGLRTLELGVESLDGAVLARLMKRQPPALVEDWLADAEGLDLWLVLNTMSGFPGQTHAEADWERRELRRMLARHPGARVHVEHNRLEVERRSAMAAKPDAFGITLASPGAWSSTVPWATSNTNLKEVA